MNGELFAWENEDGDCFVEVEMEADRDKAGQRLADERRSIFTFEGRTEIKIFRPAEPRREAPGQIGADL